MGHEKSKPSKSVPLITALLIWLAGFVVIVFALIEIIAAKLMLSICLSTAPLFIIFILFDQTRSFFDRWLGFLAGFAFVLIMVSCVLGLGMSLMHWTVAPYLNNQAENADLTSWIPICVVAVLSFYAIWKVDIVAMGIGGSCHTGTGAAMAGNALQRGKAGLSTMKEKQKSFNQWRKTAGSR